MRIDKNTTIRLGNRNIVKVKLGDVVIWQKTTEPVEGPDYFYIESLGDGNTISVVNEGNGNTTNVTPTLEYSTDKNTWNTITFDWTDGTHTTELPVKLNTGEKMYFRNDTRLFSNSSSKYIKFSSTVSSNVGGDIRTLSNYINVDNETKPQEYMFYYLFYNNKIVDASNLRLSYTTLAEYCYNSMFRDCTSLTTAPIELPATTLAVSCYGSMFGGCKSLTTAPSLPATTLVSYCYSGMFGGCTSLTTPPELPATTLASNCYDSMFRNCGLTTAPELPVTTLGYSCYSSMFFACKSLTTAPALPATKLAPYCYYSMFYDCISLTTAPKLPATTLNDNCYESMFYGCKSLTTAPALPATKLANSCYSSMFSGCSNLNKVLTYADDISTSNCTTNWLNNVASSGTLYNAGSAVYTTDSPSGIPTGWTEVTTVPTTSVYAVPNTFTAKSWMDTYRLNYIIMGVNETGIDVPLGEQNELITIGKNTGSSTVTHTETLTYDGLDYTITINQTANDTDEPDYFYIESLGDGNTISVVNQENASYETSHTPTLEYSTDKNTWNTITFDMTSGEHTTELPVKLNTGGKMYFRNDTRKFSGSYRNSISFSSSVSSNVGGDIRTLSNYINVDNETKPQEYMFVSLFNSNKNIVDASNLRLSYTTLATNCYSSMFSGCSSLTTTPELPATTLADYCYSRMFSDCTSLTTAPTELPATNLAYSCYSNMFEDCSSLTTAPELPATTLGDSCYRSMFVRCTSLTTAPALPATTMKKTCYRDMFNGCKKLTTAPALPATTLADDCYNSMFVDCEKLTTTPELPATTLASSCYSSMFMSCNSLTTAPELPATTLAPYCYNWMFNGCRKLNSITVYAKDISATNCTKDWLYNVAYSGTFNNMGFASFETGASGIPSGWIENIPPIESITVNPDTFTIEFNNETVTCNSTLTITTTTGITNTRTNTATLTVGENTGNTTRTLTETIPYKGSSYDVTIVQSAIQSITANPDTFTIKSYKDTVKCNSTLTITTTLGTTLTDTNSATITVGENTGDTTRTLTETIPYKGSSYQVTIVQTANDVKPVTSWNVESTGTYPFELNTNGYYESTNKGHDSSYSYATLNYQGFDELVLECINSGESKYDYGIISQPDVQLSESIEDDGATGSTKVFKSFKGESSTNPVQITIPSDEGSHFITIKFRKDSSQSQGNDSLQFKVIEP